MKGLNYKSNIDTSTLSSWHHCAELTFIIIILLLMKYTITNQLLLWVAVIQLISLHYIILHIRL